MPMKSTTRAFRKAHAFTTVEFMGVMVIAMILSAIAIGGLHLYEQEMPVKTDARRLNYAFANARAQAIANNGYFALNIDLGNRNFWLDETDVVGNPINPKVTHPEKLNDKVVIANAQFGLDPSSTIDGIIKVLFFPDGSSDDARFYLRLTGADASDTENIFTVRLYGPTGLSKVFENQRLEPEETS